MPRMIDIIHKICYSRTAKSKQQDLFTSYLPAPLFKQARCANYRPNAAKQQLHFSLRPAVRHILHPKNC